jgi:NADPH:quinone reductase
MPMKENMQAMVMTAIDGPEVLEQQPAPRREIDHSEEMLIRVMAAPVNPADVRLRDRMRPIAAWEVPAESIMLGLEGCGVDEAVGSSVTRSKKGDEIYYFDGCFPCFPSNCVQFKVVDQNFVAAEPPLLSFVQAAVLPVVTITTREALEGKPISPAVNAC